MRYSGNLVKMKSSLENPVSYLLTLGDNEIPINPLIGRELFFYYDGVINCINCGKRTNKSYNQGFCYNCMLTSPEADESVFRPELSKAQLGITRDMEWSIENDLIDHYVYLSVTSDLKVGVTRYHQLFTRWIDQGASMAIKLARTPNRHIAGIIEVFLKRFVADKTNWMKMIKGDLAGTYHLEEEKERLSALLPGELKNYVENDNTITEINYPIISIPQSIRQIGFDDHAMIGGKLTGIKGQYLIFDEGNVLNIRKHNGYFTELEIKE
jgi:hypothetical protein